MYKFDIKNTNLFKSTLNQAIAKVEEVAGLLEQTPIELIQEVSANDYKDYWCISILAIAKNFAFSLGESEGPEYDYLVDSLLDSLTQSILRD